MKTKYARASHRRSRSGLALEPLEPRQLLTAYLAQTVADYFHAPLDRVTSANDSLTFAYFNATNPDEGAAVVNGQFLHYSQISGLHANDDIDGVNDAGLIFGHVRASSSSASTNFIVRNGIRVLLSEAATSINAPAGVVPDYSTFSLVQVSNAGVLFQASDGTWLLAGEVLTYIWDGGASFMNAGGEIVGYQNINGAGILSFRSGTGVVTPIDSLATVTGLGPDGMVVGTVSNGALATWRSGTLTVLAPPGGFVFGPGTGYWQVVTTGSSGRVVAVLTWTAITGPTWSVSTRPYLFEPDGTVLPLDSSSSLNYLNLPTYRGADNGDVLAGSTVYKRVPDETPRTAFDGFPTATIATDTGPVTFAVNPSGELITLSKQSGDWRGTNVLGHAFRLNDGSPAPVSQILPYIDPTSGLVHAFVVAPSGVFWVVQDSGSGLWYMARLFGGFGGIDASKITSAAAFISPDGRAHLATGGTDGSLHLTYEPDGSFASVLNWVSVDLAAHLRDSGQTSVPVAGGLTAFTTAWNGLDIAYLDSAGNVRAVWWAPGRPTWAIANLSANAGSTQPLHGSLVSYVTPWGGMNVAGTDASGNLVALWWTPGMATWSADRLVEGTPAQLNENTLTAYVTPWGGLNIAGLDKVSGKLTAYWWVPGMPTWAVEEFTISGAPADLALAGRLASAVSPAGDLFITAVTADHHLANIWFGAATNYLWTFEDVTMAV